MNTKDKNINNSKNVIGNGYNLSIKTEDINKEEVINELEKILKELT
jgi:hypothetical protein